MAYRCCVVGCQNKWNTLDVKLIRFPAGSKPFQSFRRRLWLEAIKRQDWTDKMVRNKRICSAHFITGEVSLDFKCPDFVPSVFVDNGTKVVPGEESEELQARHDQLQRRKHAKTDRKLHSDKREGTPKSTPKPTLSPSDATCSMNVYPVFSCTGMAQSSWRCYCCVPFCSNNQHNKHKYPHLTFHDFPTDTDQLYLWMKAISRNEVPDFKVLRGSTYVCSLHFSPEDLCASPSGQARIREGAVPSRFYWNDWGNAAKAHKLANHHSAVDQKGPMEVQAVASAVGKDHSYTLHSSLGKLDGDVHTIKELQHHALSLEYEVKQLTLQKTQPLIYKFCVTDEDIQYFCKFSSKEVFSGVWDSVCPTGPKFIHWTKGQCSKTPSDLPGLPLIDQFFMFLCRVAAGLQEKTLSSIFEVSLSIVHQVIITWTNYLYQVLGALPLWKTREQVQKTMPEGVKQYCPHVRVIIHSTEITCEAASSPTQPKTILSPKRSTTFKGLIGISPCGVITFVSELYAGSASDLELIKNSQILQLLELGDGVMAGARFFTKETLSEVGVVLIIPPFKKSSQLSVEDTMKTQAVACLRVSVEQAIRRVKDYHIWDEPVPLPFAGSVHKLWAVCCLMSNFQGVGDIGVRTGA